MRLWLICLLLAGPVLAQEGDEGPDVAGDGDGAAYAPLPSFTECMDEEAARFERALKRLRELPDDAEGAGEFEIGDTRGTGYCGSVGFVLCDRSADLEAVQACQLRLAAAEDLLAARIRGALPAPEAMKGKGGPFEQALYPQVWALAQGKSAGADCAGDIAQRRTWCQAWEANGRLRSAVLAWQLARFLGMAETGVDAGWAQPGQPMRPRARADKG